MSFSWNSDEVSTASSLIPSGNRVLLISKASIKPTQDGREYANIMFIDVETGTTGWASYYGDTEAGRKEFTKLFKACGLSGQIGPETIDNMRMHRVVVKVSSKPDTKGVMRNTFYDAAPEVATSKTPVGGSDCPF